MLPSPRGLLALVSGVLLQRHRDLKVASTCNCRRHLLIWAWQVRASLVMAEHKEGTKITLAELAKHTTQNDAWMVIDGKVYDVTKFLEEHPGGDAVLMENAGKDATEEFEEIGHSSSAREQLQDFYIGDADEVAPFPKSSHKMEALKASRSNLHEESSGLAWKVFQFSVPLVLLGIAYYVKVQLQPADV